jgi:hypothetical protein
MPSKFLPQYRYEIINMNLHLKLIDLTQERFCKLLDSQSSVVVPWYWQLVQLSPCEYHYVPEKQRPKSGFTRTLQNIFHQSQTPL